MEKSALSKSIQFFSFVIAILVLTTNISLVDLCTEHDSVVYAQLVPETENRDWGKITQIPFFSDFSQCKPTTTLGDNNLKIVWREYQNEKIFWASYNGATFQGIEQINCSYSVQPCIISLSGQFFSVYYNSEETFLESLDQSVKTSSQPTNGRTNWDFAAVNYQDKIFLFHSVENDGFGSSQIWVYTCDGESWTEPQQLTFSPRFAYMVDAIVANEKIYVVFSSGPPPEEMDGGWFPTVYLMIFDGKSWSDPQPCFQGAPMSLTSYGNDLYLVYEDVGNLYPRLRIFHNNVWSEEENIPIPNTFLAEHAQEEIGEITSFFYNGQFVIVCSRYLETSEPEDLKASLWFITYPDQSADFDSNNVEIINGLAIVDHSSTTGVSVSISGLSSQEDQSLCVETVEYGETYPLGTGAVQGGVLAFYDVKISSAGTLDPDSVARLSIKNSKFSTDQHYVISYWNGNNWISIETSIGSSNTITGSLLASNLFGTPIMVGTQDQITDEGFLSNQQIFLIGAGVIMVVFVSAIVIKTRKNKK